jgi:hypothetical protein
VIAVSRRRIDGPMEGAKAMPSPRRHDRSSAVIKL